MKWKEEAEGIRRSEGSEEWKMNTALVAVQKAEDAVVDVMKLRSLVSLRTK